MRESAGILKCFGKFLCSRLDLAELGKKLRGLNAEEWPSGASEAVEQLVPGTLVPVEKRRVVVDQFCVGGSRSRRFPATAPGVMTKFLRVSTRLS